MKRFDLRGAIIPFSLLAASNHFREMKPGESMEVIASDPEPIKDLKNILPEGRFSASEMQDSQGASKDFRVCVKKTRAPEKEN